MAIDPRKDLSLSLREKIPGILGWLAFAAACSAFFLPITNPDIYWHLSAGKQTLANWGPPRTDLLSWPLYGAEWVDFEWLPQVFYFLLYKAGGFKALILLKGLLVSLTLLVFRRTVLLYGRRTALPFVLVFLAAAIMANCDVRPDNFTLLFFTVTLYFLEKSRLAGLPGGRYFPVAFAVFFAAWANIHAGYLYGLALIGFYAAGEFAAEETPWIYGGRFARPDKSLAYLGYLFLGLASSLVNPYGWKIYSVILNHQKYMGALEARIQEWSPSTLSDPYQWPYNIALAALLPALAFFILKKRHVVYSHLACLVFFAVVSSSHVRHIPFFIITGLVFALALPWDGLISPRGRQGLLLAGFCLWLPLTMWFYNRYIWSHYTGNAAQIRTASAGLAEFLKENKSELSGLRVYNSWAWGGWLGWETAPQYRVFQDGRYLFHDKILEFTNPPEAYEQWPALLKKYGFGLMLVPLSESPLVDLQYLENGEVKTVSRPAYLLYLPKKDWAVVYWDRRVAAIVRRSGVPGTWLAAHEFKYLRPLDMKNLAEPVMAGEIKIPDLQAELRRYAEDHRARDEYSAAAETAYYVKSIMEHCGGRGARAGKGGGYSLKSQPR